MEKAPVPTLSRLPACCLIISNWNASWQAAVTVDPSSSWAKYRKQELQSIWGFFTWCYHLGNRCHLLNTPQIINCRRNVQINVQISHFPQGLASSAHSLSLIWALLIEYPKPCCPSWADDRNVPIVISAGGSEGFPGINHQSNAAEHCSNERKKPTDWFHVNISADQSSAVWLRW